MITMTQDFKCFMGIHKLTILEQQEIKDYERPIAKVIISCCTNCGKIKEKYISLKPKSY